MVCATKRCLLCFSGCTYLTATLLMMQFYPTTRRTKISWVILCYAIGITCAVEKMHKFFIIIIFFYFSEIRLNRLELSLRDRSNYLALTSLFVELLFVELWIALHMQNIGRDVCLLLLQRFARQYHRQMPTQVRQIYKLCRKVGEPGNRQTATIPTAARRQRTLVPATL